jgi:hypothetical protein
MASWEEEETEGIREVGMRILGKTKPDFLLVIYGVRIWFGVSRCLSFLLFLSLPSSSFLLV